MSPDELAFYRAIWEKPGDDAPRLIFADWLDETCVERNADVADLIRKDVQCRYGKTKDRAKIKIGFLQRRLKGSYKYVELPMPPLSDTTGLLIPWIDCSATTPEYIEWHYETGRGLPIDVLYEHLKKGIYVPESWIRAAIGLPILPTSDSPSPTHHTGLGQE